MKIIVVDNYDSFVYNICDYIGRLGYDDIEIYRNDSITVAELISLNLAAVVISPGPGSPEDAGISVELIKALLENDIPVLGVCLGHQAIVHALGGRVIKAERILHGKTSMIKHDSSALFKGLDNPFPATRYHSLIAEEKSMPEALAVTARSEEEEIMAVGHKDKLCFGVQFHPESILTENGIKVIANFLELSESAYVS